MFDLVSLIKISSLIHMHNRVGHHIKSKAFVPRTNKIQSSEIDTENGMAHC